MAEKNKTETDAITFKLIDKLDDGTPTGNSLKSVADSWDSRQRNTRWGRTTAKQLLEGHKGLFTEGTVEAIQKRVPIHFQLHALMDYRVPTSGLTLEDFLSYCRQQSAQGQDRRNGNWNADYVGSYHSNSYSDWRVTILIERSGLTKQAYLYRDIFFMIAREGEKNGNRTTFDRVFTLNELLKGDFQGTLEEYKAHELAPNVAEDSTNFILRDLSEDMGNSMRSNVLGFSPSTQKRSRVLLDSQDRKTWEVMVEKAQRWQKGHDHTGITTFVAEAQEEVAAGGKVKLPTVDENNKELILLMISSFTKIENLTAERFNALVTSSITSVPNSYQGEAYRREFRDLIKLLKEGEGVRPREIVGLIFAALHPTLWCRNGSKSGATLLLELLHSEEGPTYRAIITDIVLGKDRDVPTEKEWRESVGVIQEGMMAEWALPMISRGSKAPRKSVPDNVAILRKHVL